jgi:general secretion pathway protein C
VELVALVFAEGRSEWSMASLATASKTPLLYREGSSVQDMQVVTILREAVYLRQSGGRLCSLALFSTRALTVARTPPPETTALRVDALDQNIRALSDTRFRVRRSFVDQLLQNPSEILAARRIIPHAENGQVVGLKLYGIRRHSLLARLGLQNGDSLRTINGYAMSSLDTALEAYAKLRGANRLSVTVERRGRSVILDYAIE